MEEWTARGRGGTIKRGTLDRLGATESEAQTRALGKKRWAEAFGGVGWGAVGMSSPARPSSSALRAASSSTAWLPNGLLHYLGVL